MGTVINGSGISDVFAKLLLSDSPGQMIYNSFLSAPKFFDPPIAKLDTMNFKVVTSRGHPFNFNDIDYSFSLEIVELVDSLKNSELSSRTGNTQYDNINSNTSQNTTDKLQALRIGNKSGSQDTGFNAGIGVVRTEGGRGSGFR
jgi:hypothetical protein